MDGAVRGSRRAVLLLGGLAVVSGCTTAGDPSSPPNPMATPPDGSPRPYTPGEITWKGKKRPTLVLAGDARDGFDETGVRLLNKTTARVERTERGPASLDYANSGVSPMDSRAGDRNRIQVGVLDVRHWEPGPEVHSFLGDGYNLRIGRDERGGFVVRSTLRDEPVDTPSTFATVTPSNTRLQVVGWMIGSDELDVNRPYQEFGVESAIAVVDARQGEVLAHHVLPKGQRFTGFRTVATEAAPVGTIIDSGTAMFGLELDPKGVSAAVVQHAVKQFALTTLESAKSHGFELG